MEITKYLVATFLIVLLNSCIQTEPTDTKTEYYITNESGHTCKLILLRSFNDTLEFDTNNQIYLVYLTDGIMSPLLCDSLDVQFPDLRSRYSWLNESKRNPLLKENYIETKINENHFKYEYSITEQDYLDADSIK